MSNKQMGNGFEAEFCEILFNYGFWAHNLAQNQAGQPADVLAVRNEKAYLIDCKVCSGNSFPLSRIEENQELSMSLWKSCGNGEGWFALLMDEKVYMIPRSIMEILQHSKSALNSTEIVKHGELLEKWVMSH